MSKQERQSGFELLRLILMLMIVAQHIINNGVLSVAGAGRYGISVPVGSLGTFLEVAVNSFVLISGYFGIRFGIKKILNLILDMVVIGISVYIIVVITGFVPFSVMSLIYYAVPIHWWFIVYYIVLMIFAPYINFFIGKITKKEFLWLLILMFFIFSVAKTFIGYEFGGGVMNFFFMYLVGRFIRMHVKKDLPAYIYAIGYVGFTLLSAAGDYVLYAWFNTPYTWGIRFFQSDSVFIICASICFFSMFKSIKFKSTIVNTLAKSALGIYIIHEHPVVREFYLKKLGVLSSVDGSFAGWAANFVLVLFAVYTGALVIETVRLLIFAKLNDKLCGSIAGLKLVRAFEKWWVIDGK